MTRTPDLRPVGHVTQPDAPARLVCDEFVHGRQYGVDAVRFGAPYVFARLSTDSVWMIWAGPFASDDAAIQWIHDRVDAAGVERK